MRNMNEVRAVWLLVLAIGEVVITSVSFAFGRAWFVFWILAQLGLLVLSVPITNLLFTIKERGKK